MAEKKDIKEGKFFITSTGRIGKAYAIGKRNKEEGTVNLFFDGPGGVCSGENFSPPSGVFNVESLTLIKNKYYKITVDGEVYNRVEDSEAFVKQFAHLGVEIEIEKLLDEEFEETEK